MKRSLKICKKCKELEGLRWGKRKTDTSYNCRLSGEGILRELKNYVQRDLPKNCPNLLENIVLKDEKKS